MKRLEQKPLSIRRHYVLALPQGRHASSQGKTEFVRLGPGECGMSLIETLIGLLVLTIVIVSAGQLLRVQVLHLALSERSRLADTQGNNALNLFAGYNQSALPDCNPFQGKNSTDPINDGEQLSLNTNTCLTTYACDQVVKVPQSSGTASDYVVIAWNQSLPAGGTLAYYRAWRVTTLDSARHLRRITVAILPADLGRNPGDPVEPLALRISDVVQRQ
jgi:hypothetical protein